MDTKLKPMATEKDVKVVNTVLKWKMIAAATFGLLLATIFAKVEGGGDQHIRDLIAEYRPLSVAYRTVTSATPYQPSLTRYTDVSLSVKVACVSTLTGGQDGTISFQTSPDNITYTTVSSVQNSSTVALAIAITVNSSNGGVVGGKVPPGYYYKIIYTSTTGTPTFSILTQAQEVSL